MRPTQQNVLILGPSGCGKTFFVVRWLIEEILPYSDIKIVTNLPFGVVPDGFSDPPKFDGETFIDRMEAEVKRLHGIEVRDRIKLLEKQDLDAWMDGQGGPWELDEEWFDGSECFFLLDEFGNYVSKGLKHTERNGDWIKWLATSRHNNVRNLMISQTAQKIPKALVPEFAERWALADTSSNVLPSGVNEGDLNQFLSKLCGRHIAATQCKIEVFEGRWIGKGIHKFARTKHWFKFYNSFSAEHKGKGSDGRKLEYQRLGWFRFIGWFMARNPGWIGRQFRMLCVIGAVILFFLNFESIMNRVINAVDVGNFVGVTDQAVKRPAVPEIPVLVDQPEIELGKESTDNRVLLGVINGRNYWQEGKKKWLE